MSLLLTTLVLAACVPVKVRTVSAALTGVASQLVPALHCVVVLVISEYVYVAADAAPAANGDTAAINANRLATRLRRGFLFSF